jgi:hypothetical protein
MNRPNKRFFVMRDVHNLPERDPAKVQELADARAMRLDGNGPLLVEMQTNGRPLRFAVTTANALRFAEWLAKAALGAQDLGSFAG